MALTQAQARMKQNEAVRRKTAQKKARETRKKAWATVDRIKAQLERDRTAASEALEKAKRDVDYAYIEQASELEIAIFNLTLLQARRLLRALIAADLIGEEALGRTLKIVVSLFPEGDRK